MGIGNVIRGIGKGAVGVGRAVQAVSKAMDKPFQDAPDAPDVSPVVDPADANNDGTTSPTEKRAWETAGHKMSPSYAADGKQQGWDLPDIESETMKSPEGKDVPNPYFIPKTIMKDGKSVDNPDYKDAAETHRAMTELDRIHTEANPHIDYVKEYSRISAEQKANQNRGHRGNPLIAAGIALGAGPEAAARYARVNQEADKGDAEAADKTLQFKKSLVDAHVKQLVEEGKWKEALRANEVSSNLDRRMKESAAQSAHQRDLELEREKSGSRERVAQTRAQALVRTTQERVHAIATQRGLTGEFEKAFYKQMGIEMGKASTSIMYDPDNGPSQAMNVLDLADQIASKLRSEQEKGGAAAGKGGGGKKVQMFKDGKPVGAPISPDDFARRGGAASAAQHGYSFKMQ